MMINMKLLVSILAIVFLSCAFAQVGKKEYGSYEEKMEDYQRNMSLYWDYWSKIKDDNSKLSIDKKKSHLNQYRKKMMKILNKNENIWEL